jgi:hypothetical protein
MDGEPMTTTTKNAPEAGQGFEGNDHDDSAEDLMNISTVAVPADTDIKIKRWHESTYLIKNPPAWVLFVCSEPHNTAIEDYIDAAPVSWFHRGGQEAEGYQWGHDDPDFPGEYIFTSLGLHDLVGYEVSIDGTRPREAFTGVFRKIEAAA